MNPVIMFITRQVFPELITEIALRTAISAYESLSDLSLIDLTIESFQEAFDEQMLHFQKYSKEGEVSFDPRLLEKILRASVPVQLEGTSVWELSQEEILDEFCNAITSHELIIIGGHELTGDDYAQITRTLVSASIRKLKKKLVSNETAYRQAVLQGLSNSQASLEELKSSLQSVQHLLEKTLPSDELIHPLRFIPHDHKARLNNFLVEYLGTSEKPVPFGGRADVFSFLNVWIGEGSAKPYLALVSEAGKGKTSVLIRWYQYQLAQADTHVLFVPISIRFRTSLDSVFFPLLNSILANLHNEPTPDFSQTSIEQLRTLACDYLRRGSPDDKSLIVIIDGIDEATGWQVGPDLFPLDPPKDLRLIVSARSVAGDTTGSEWLSRLAWEGKQIASILPLNSLDEPEVSDAILSLNKVLGELVEDDEFRKEVFRISLGDPIVLRFLLDEIVDQIRLDKKIDLKKIKAFKPGLDGLFNQWIADQKVQWEANKDVGFDEAFVRDFLLACSFSFGPLTSHDMALVLGTKYDFADTYEIAEAASSLQRFIVGDGNTLGYSLAHPRFRDFFIAQFTSPEQREEWRYAFLQLGEEHLRKLRNGDIKPPDASRYFIQYYGAHLSASVEDSGKMIDLICKEWMQAWTIIDETHLGYLTDIERVRAFSVETGSPLFSYQLLCGLIRTSIASMGSRFPFEFAKYIIECGQLSPDQIWRRYLTSTIENQLQCAIPVMDTLPHKMLRDAIIHFLGILPFLDDYIVGAAQPNILGPLEEFLETLPFELIPVVLEEAPRVRGVSCRYVIYSTLKKREDIDRSDLLTSVQKIQDEYETIRMLVLISDTLPEEENKIAGSHAYDLWAAEPIRVDPSAICEFFPILTDALKIDAISKIKNLENEEERFSLIFCTFKSVPDSMKNELAPVCAQYILKANPRSYSIHDIIPEILTYLPVDVQADLYHHINKNVHEIHRINILTRSIQFMTKEIRDIAFNEIISLCKNLKNDRTLERVIMQLSKVADDGDYKKIDEAADFIQDITIRIETLRWMREAFPETEKGKINLNLERFFEDGKFTFNTLEKTIPYFVEKIEGDFLNEVFEIGLQAICESRRSTIFKHTLPIISEDQKRLAFSKIIAIQDESYKVAALELILPYLPESLIRKFLKTVGQITNEWDRLSLLRSSIPHISADHKEILLELTLGITTIEHKYSLLTDLVSATEGELQHKCREHISALSGDISASNHLIDYLDTIDPLQRCEIIDTILGKMNVDVDVLGRFELFLRTAELEASDRKLEYAFKAIDHLHQLDNNQRWHISKIAICSLRNICDQIPQDELTELVTSILTIPNIDARASILDDIVDHIQDSLVAEIIGSFLTDNVSETGLLICIKLLKVKDQTTHRDLIKEIVEAIKQLEFSSTHSQLIGEIRECLEEDEVLDLINWASNFPDDEYQRNVLLSLLPFPDNSNMKSLLNNLYTSSHQIENEYKRVESIYKLFPFLSGDTAREAMQYMETTDAKYKRGSQLLWIFKHSKEMNQDNIFFIIEELENDYEKGEAISSLIEHLDLDHQEQAINVLFSLGQRSSLAKVITEIIDKVSPVLIQVIIENIFSTVDSSTQAQSLFGISTRIPAEYKHKVIDIFDEIEDDALISGLYNTSTPIAPWLLNQLMPKIMTQPDHYLFQSPEDLFFGFFEIFDPDQIALEHPEILEQSLTHALTIIPDRFHSEDSRPEALSNLSLHLRSYHKLQPEKSFELITSTINKISQNSRCEYLREVAALMPWILISSEISSAGELIAPIEKILNWWN